MKFRKIMSIIASAVMLSSTMGFASAATFPAPFDSGSAIVYGANGNVQMDMASAVNIQTAIGKVSGSDAAVGIPTGSWQVKTSSDNLEIGEPIANVTSYIGANELPILADGQLTNEKGTAKYEQFLYFDDKASSVTYTDDGNENIGLFYKANSGTVIARYVMDFTTNLQSDIDASNVLNDVKDKELVILGKTYTITNAVNSSASQVDLTLMGGANKVTISNGEELTVGGKKISVMVTDTNKAKFTVDGSTTSNLAVGDTETLDDGTYLGVSDITYQNFAGGLMQATVYVGADKLFLDDGSSLQVNGKTVSNTNVNITKAFSNGDVSISAITINMTAEDNLFVPVGSSLSKAVNLDHPEVLFSQNWDIAFKGLADATYETDTLKRSSDAKMKLDFTNFNDYAIDMPLMYSNTTGIFAGDRLGYELVLNASAGMLNNSGAGVGIAKNQYFILNTANPTTGANANNAKSFVVQYKGSDKVTAESPTAKFDILGGDNNKEVSVSSAGVINLQLGGTTFVFNNVTTGVSNDFNIALAAGSDYATSNGAAGSLSGYLRTGNNVLVNITDTNATAGGFGDGSSWKVIMTQDDTNVDGDNYLLSTARTLFTDTLLNDSSGNIADTVAAGTGNTWETDPSDSNHQTFVTNFGTKIDYVNPSSSPGTVEIQVPASAVEPLVFVTSGAVSAGTTATGGLALIVDDSKIDTVKDMNLVVVGGSCINAAAAKILGSATPLCASAFTEKTLVGVNQYIIKTVASPYNAAKVAILVAGYEGADTLSAAKLVAEKTVKTDIGTSQVYPIASA